MIMSWVVWGLVMVSIASLELPTSTWTVRVARYALDGLLDAAGVAVAICGDLAVALSEACTNAVSHASSGPSYRVEICVDETRCTMEVRDRGPGFDPGLVRTSDLDSDGGRGLFLMRALVDQVRIEVLWPHGMKVVMVKSWDHVFGGHPEDGHALDYVRAPTPAARLRAG
jgi:serine/threonine-protein kinase RsbW